MANANVEQYAINEKALCYHGPLIYEAKILKVDNTQGPHPVTGQEGAHYFVHYKGWKQTCVSVLPVRPSPTDTPSLSHLSLPFHSPFLCHSMRAIRSDGMNGCRSRGC